MPGGIGSCWPAIDSSAAGHLKRFRVTPERIFVTHRQARLRPLAFLTLVALVALFLSCAHTEEKAKRDPQAPQFQRPENYRPQYMNGR